MTGPNALPIRRGTCEAVLLLAVAAWLGVKTGPLFPLEALGLAALAGGGVFAEAYAPKASVLRAHQPRPFATPGISLGVLALPLLYGAKLLVDGGGTWDHLAFWVAVASGAGAVTSVLQKGSSGSLLRWWPAAASTACCALCAAAGSSGSVQVATAVALLAGACQYPWHFLMRQFPQSFTAGEAFLLAQGSTLLLGAVLLRTLHLEAQVFTPGLSPLHHWGPNAAAQVDQSVAAGQLDVLSLIIQAVLTSLLTSAAAYSAIKPALLFGRKHREMGTCADRLLKPVSFPKGDGVTQYGNELEGREDSRDRAKWERNGAHKQNGWHEIGALEKPRSKEAARGYGRSNQQIESTLGEPSPQQVLAFYTLVATSVGVVAPLWLSKVVDIGPVEFAFQFLSERFWTKAGLCAYWLLLLGASLPTLPPLAASRKLPSILVRKAYHALAVAMFAPALLFQPVFLQLAFGGALSLFLLLEIIRLHCIPPIAAPLDAFLRRFTDDRDRGPLIVSHFSLLLGCALPLWSAPASFSPSLASFAGVLSIGLGDTMASMVGVKYGRTRICIDSKKTVEGTCAGFLSMLLGMLAVQCCMGSVDFQVYYLVATLVASLLEAFTVQSDNVFVPVVYATLLILGP